MTVGTAEAVEPTLSLAQPTPLASATRPWPAGSLTRREVVARLHSAEVSSPRNRSAHRVGIELAVDWLDQQPGGSWQERWLASGVENDAAVWRQTPLGWLADRGHGESREDGFFRALRLLIGLDIIRPSMGWLVAARFYTRQPDPTRRPATETRPGSPGWNRCARRTLTLPLRGAPAPPIGQRSCWPPRAACSPTSLPTMFSSCWMLRPEPAALRSAPLIYSTGFCTRWAYSGRTHRRHCGSCAPPASDTPEQIVDRYRLRVQPMRDLLVDYLRERQPALDYTSLESLAGYLVGLFWADIERHHPEITNLQLPTAVADGWKQRLRTITKTVRGPDGRPAVVSAPRVNYRECLTPVRAFYLDLAHWALEDPSRWGGLGGALTGGQ